MGFGFISNKFKFILYTSRYNNIMYVYMDSLGFNDCSGVMNSG